MLNYESLKNKQLIWTRVIQRLFRTTVRSKTSTPRKLRQTQASIQTSTTTPNHSTCQCTNITLQKAGCRAQIIPTLGRNAVPLSSSSLSQLCSYFLLFFLVGRLTKERGTAIILPVRQRVTARLAELTSAIPRIARLLQLIN